MSGMAPFIKFTDRSRSPSAEQVYLNASHIAKATYRSESRELEIVLKLDTGKRPCEVFKLHGDEADAALKVLQELP
jgi:hypothetical protein